MAIGPLYLLPPIELKALEDIIERTWRRGLSDRQNTHVLFYQTIKDVEIVSKAAGGDTTWRITSKKLKFYPTSNNLLRFHEDTYA